MKFDFAIGNPPYQDETLGENDKYAPPVYNKFMDSAYKIADKVELIHPARFLFNAGSTPKDWNKRMLNDPHFKVLDYETDAKKIFPTTTITGGIAISYYDTLKSYSPISFFSPYKELNSIITKVTNTDGFESFSAIVSGRTPYLFTEDLHDDYPFVKERLSDGHMYDIPSEAFSRLPEIFTTIDGKLSKNYYRVLGRIDNKRDYRKISKKYARERNENVSIGKWKVLLPKANGASGMLSQEPARLISMPVIGSPNDIATDTFVFVGPFDTEFEALSAHKYMLSKFARVLLGALKVTQNNSKETWRFVPNQNYSHNSDICWDDTIADIDTQLFKKYGLSEEEIHFIESHVKEMA